MTARSTPDPTDVDAAFAPASSDCAVLARILVASPWLTLKGLLVRDDAVGMWAAAAVPDEP